MAHTTIPEFQVSGLPAMPNATLLKLFPEHQMMEPGNDEIASSFLDESLVPSVPGTPLIFANLLTSLDGRIALADSSVRSGMSTPDTIRTDLDWKVFCHLQAHADVLITHSGYLRSLESEELGNILNLADTQPRLLSFRKQVGLSSAPRVVVLTSSLDFDHNFLRQVKGHVTLLITRHTSTSSEDKLRSEGFDVVRTDDHKSVSAHTLLKYLESISARNAYLQTGPEMLHDMLQNQLLQRLYLTLDLSIVGGDIFKTICDGALLPSPAKMHLQALYLASVADKQQMFLSFTNQPTASKN